MMGVTGTEVSQHEWDVDAEELKSPFLEQLRLSYFGEGRKDEMDRNVADCSSSEGSLG